MRDQRSAEVVSDLRWIPDVIVNGNYTKLDSEALEVARRLRATDTQVRTIFGTIKRLESMRNESDLKRELALLRPRLAYTAARHDGLNELSEIVTKASKLAEEKPSERTQRLVDLMEAILCYTKTKVEKRR